MIDILASAIVGYCVEHTADFARAKAEDMASEVRRAHFKQRPRVYRVTYRTWLR